jgi:hypothetical protein
MKQALDIGGSDPLDADRKEAEVWALKLVVYEALS